jgi:parallel beta-helix repeat protein
VKKTAHDSILFVALLLLASGFLVHVCVVDADSAFKVTITESGAVVGSSASSIQHTGDTYTLTGDLGAELVIQKDNITVDGAGFSIQSAYTCIDLTSRTNVTVKNVQAKAQLDQVGYAFGIVLTSSTNITLTNNQVTSPFDPQSEIRFVRGIVLDRSTNCVVTSNTVIMQGSRDGIVLTHSSGNVVTNNVFHGCTVTSMDSQQNTITNNTVEGKQVVNLQGAADQVVSGAGEVTLVDCNNITVRDCDAPLGIKLVNTHISVVTNCTSNIKIENSHQDTVTGCAGTFLATESTDLTIEANRFSNVTLKDCWTCTIRANNITGTASSDIGVELYRSHNCTVTGNTIQDHATGIRLYYSGYNTFTQNNVLNNQVQVASSSSANQWDNGTIGNYWSSYLGADADGDGVGEEPYVIDADNMDRFPLTQRAAAPSPKPTQTPAPTPSPTQNPTESPEQTPFGSASTTPTQLETSPAAQPAVVPELFLYAAAAAVSVLLVVFTLLATRREKKHAP